MAGIPTIDKAEIERLAVEWQKAKHCVVMIDPVAIQFTTDACNLVLRNYLEDVIQRVAAKKAAATAEGKPLTDPTVDVPAAAAPAPKKKSSLVLTDI